MVGHEPLFSAHISKEKAPVRCVDAKRLGHGLGPSWRITWRPMRRLTVPPAQVRNRPGQGRRGRPVTGRVHCAWVVTRAPWFMGPRLTDAVLARGRVAVVDDPSGGRDNRLD